MSRAWLLLVTALIVGLPLAAAQSDPSQGPATDPDAEAWALEPRTLAVLNRADGFSFVSKRSSDLGTDEFSGGFNVREAAYNYRFVAAGEDPVNLTVELIFGALIEFEDRNNNGQFELGDTILQYIALPDHQGRRIFTPSTETEAPYRSSATYLLPGGGHFALMFTLAERPINVADRLVRPTQTAIDLEIADFPYRSNTSSIALETRTTSNVEGELRGGRASGLYYADQPHEALYRWHPIARLNTGPDVVGVTALGFHQDATGPSHSYEDTAVLAYEHADHVAHGMEVGVRPMTGPVTEVLEAIRGDWRVFLFGMIATSGLIGGAAYLKLREEPLRGSSDHT